MVTMNPAKAFKDVPLNEASFRDWQMFAEALLERVRSVGPDLVQARMKARRQELLGPNSDPAFKERKEAWDETLDNLLAVKSLEAELARIARLLKADAPTGGDQANP